MNSHELHALVVQLGQPASLLPSRNQCVIKHGRSLVKFPSGDGKLPDPLPLQWRKEGGPHEEKFERIPLADVVQFIAEVLSTGRTCEVGAGVGLRNIGWRIPRGNGVTMQWHVIADMVDGRLQGERLNLNPDYQRGAVWDEGRQRRFIGHALEEGLVPPVYIHRDDTFMTEETECVDGQQRLRAIREFVRGNIPGDVYIPGEGVRSLWFKDFDEDEQRDRRLTIEVIYGDWPRQDRLKFYLRLNAGGVAHTESELDKVRDLLAKEG